MLLVYEPILNVLITESGLTKAERDAMFRVHHVLRRRASGELREYEMTSDTFSQCTDA